MLRQFPIQMLLPRASHVACSDFSSSKLSSFALGANKIYLNIMKFTMRHYATSRKVVNLIPDEVIGFFN
jgi:hypothetical protein